MRNIKFDDIDDVLMNEDYDTEYVPYVIKDESMGEDEIIIIESEFFRVIDKGVIFAEGCFCVENEERVFEPDFSVVVIYDDTEDEKFDFTKYIYYENSSAQCSIHNYLTIKGEVDKCE